jgi:hypothetical protein
MPKRLLTNYDVGLALYLPLGWQGQHTMPRCDGLAISRSWLTSSSAAETSAHSFWIGSKAGG